MTDPDRSSPRLRPSGPWGRRPISGQSPLRGAAPPACSLLLLGVLVGCGGGGAIDDPTPLFGDIPIDYPMDLWDADVEGETLLRIRVSATGTVDSVEVLEASGYPAFDSAAVRGARDLRYDPARRNGKRISVWAKVPIQFTKGG